jgi:eukaryotic-like serine/threonine-protein kinase
VDVRNPAEPVTVQHHPQLYYVAISPDGQWVATGTWYGAGVKLWHATSGRLWRELPADGSAAVAFSPEGNWLVVATEREYRFWDGKNWERRHAVGKQPEIEPGGLAFADDGTLLAIRHSPSKLCLIDPATGRQFAELQPPNQQTLLWHCLSRDGRRLAGACPGGAILVWDLHLIRQQLAQQGLDW